jgi:hypothetical protein
VGDYTFRHRAPIALQNGASIPIRYRIDQKRHSIGFSLGVYDHSRTLVIDPVIEYSTYLGGNSSEIIDAIAPAGDGTLLLAGSVYADFNTALSPFPGLPLPTSAGGGEIVILRLNSTATQVLSSTYLGGSGAENVTAMAFDAAGNIVVAGTTSSPNFPGASTGFLTAPPVLFPASEPSGGFVARLNPTATQVLSSTYLPMSAPALAVSPTGDMAVAGVTRLDTVPTNGSSLQRLKKGTQDIVLLRLTPASGLAAATYFGGTEDGEAVVHLALDSAGNIRIVGTASGRDIPAPAGFTPHPQAGNLFVATIPPSLSAISSLSLPPSAFIDQFNSTAAFTAAGGLLVLTATQNRMLTTTPDAVQTVPIGLAPGHLFYQRFAPNLGSVEYATYLSGSALNNPGKITVDPAGDIYVMGNTTSTDFPVSANALFSRLEEGTGNSSTFLTRFAPNNALRYSTYLTGKNLATRAMATPAAGIVYLAGTTAPSSLPVTPNAVQSIPGTGVFDAFALKLNLDSACTFSVNPASLTAPGDGGTLLLTVQTQPGCNWTANTASNWATISRPNATQVAVTVPSGFGFGRSTMLFVAGQPIPLNQAPATCSYSLNPSTVSIPAFGGNVLYNMQTLIGCTWRYERSDPWLIGSPSDAFGNLRALINYSPSPRTGTAVLAGQTLTVNQAGNTCTYSVSPTSVRIEPNVNNRALVRVTTGSRCDWDAQIPSSSWIADITVGSGSGDAAITAFLGTSGPARTEIVTIAGQSVTVTFAGSTGGTTPTATVTSPRSSAGERQSFEWSFYDNDGVDDLRIANVLINRALDGAQACYLAYDRPNRTLFLVNDAGDNLTAGLLGAAGTLSNSQCVIHLATSQVSDIQFGFGFTLRLDIEFRPAFAGNKIIYSAARDRAGLNSGWITGGTYGVRTPGSANPMPISLTLTRVPLISRWEARVVFRNTGGGGGITSTQLLLNTSLNGANACYIGFDHVANVAYLVNDDGTGLIPTPIVPGGNGSVSHSLCVVEGGAGTSRVVEGDQVILTFRLNFLSNFRGQMVGFAGAQNSSGANSGWQSLLSFSMPE